MRDYYLVLGLKKLHGDMHQRLLAANAEARKLRADMAHVEHVIKILRPEERIVLLSIKRRYPKQHFFKRGHLIREAVRVLRDEGKSMSAHEIALKLLASKRITDPSKAQRHSLASGLLTALRTHKGKSVISNGARPQRWEPLRP